MGWVDFINSIKTFRSGQVTCAGLLILPGDIPSPSRSHCSLAWIAEVMDIHVTRISDSLTECRCSRPFPAEIG